MASFLEDTLYYIQESGRVLDIKEDFLEILKHPKKILEVSIPVRMDDKSVKVFRGWRVQHNDALGPFKGGIRFDVNVSLEEVTALATLMSLKTSAVGLPYGGAKGGIICDPRSLSTRELEKLYRRYVDAIYKLIGPETDVPAPDVNTNPQIMAWMMDEYSRLSGHTVAASFTGKPVEIGGIEAREAATGYGGYIVLREALKNMNWKKKPKETTIAVQGFGNVGSNIAKILNGKGFNVVAISDKGGGIYDEDGIDIDAVIEAKQAAGTIQKNRCYPKSVQQITSNISCREITNQELLELNVDVLVPAAIESVLTRENAPGINAKIILEMANGPTTRDADEIFAHRNIFVIPDIIANAGGVAVSYLEWVENRQGYFWNTEEVIQKLDLLMSKAFAEAGNRAQKFNSSLRMGAYLGAVEKIARAMNLRGWTE